MTKFIIVGAGHMGGAIAKALCASNQHEVAVVDTDESKLERFRRTGTQCSTGFPKPREADAVILAIPPQAFRQFAADCDPLQGHGGLILSVMAGLGVQRISSALATTQVVRSIPNTPSEIGWGMSVFFADPHVSDPNLRVAESALKAIGEVLQVDRESMLDPATALCGGGPAFVAYFVDALRNYGVDAGFSDADAMRMALQVLRGTGELLRASEKLPMQVCHEVMTPQGTTERGIRELEGAHFHEVVGRALRASADRSHELNAHDD